jgi:acyl-CoA thioesterase
MTKYFEESFKAWLSAVGRTAEKRAAMVNEIRRCCCAIPKELAEPPIMSGFQTIIDQLDANGAGGWTINPPEDWRQGRTLFGGLSAALCFAACERLVPDLPPLRTGQIAFIAPSAGAVTLSPSVIRRGKSVTFMGCDLIADGQVAVRAIFAFGAARPSAHRADAPAMPDVPPPDACPPLFGKIRPAFTVHLDQRFAGGARPGAGADKGDMLVWVRHDPPQENPSLAALIALGDALPPASITRFTAPGIISTMTWGFDLVAPERDDGTGWYLIRTTDDAVASGYAGQMMGMWDETGHPVMIARQSVAVFA